MKYASLLMLNPKVDYLQPFQNAGVLFNKWQNRIFIMLTNVFIILTKSLIFNNELSMAVICNLVNIPF